MCLLTLLTQHQDSTPLILACAYGHLKLAVLLIQHGAMIDYVNKVRPLYVHGGHGVAQNAVLSLE